MNETCLSFYAFEKGNKLQENRKKHRALMDDTRESIAELKYYKDNIFKPQKYKR
jgi:oligoribonuclease